MISSTASSVTDATYIGSVLVSVIKRVGQILRAGILSGNVFFNINVENSG